MNGPRRQPRPPNSWILPQLAAPFRVVTTVIGVAAAASLFAEFGLASTSLVVDELHRVQWIVALGALVQLGLEIGVAVRRVEFMRRHRADVTAAVGFAVALTVTVLMGASPALPVRLVQVYLAVFLVLRLPALHRILLTARLHPSLVVLITFLVIMSVGTVLLLLPKSLAPGRHLGVLDAVFTATSATCVTGLIVVDTGSHFSLMGHLVILGLIQVGGLGLMTFTSFFALVSGRGISIKDRAYMREILSRPEAGKLGTLIGFILVITLVSEALGAVILYPVFHADVQNMPQAVHLAVFHGVSAFCNAGFCLFRDSFVQYQDNVRLNLVVTTLIVWGGVGFMVNASLVQWVWNRARKKRAVLSLQSKLVLLVTVVLIAAGMGLVLLGEASGLLRDAPWGLRLLAAYFQSVTARTAGFNTLPITAVGLPTTFVLMLLMFIGASPGSTGGGTKTSTFATMVATIRSMARGKTRTEVFHRTIPRTVVYQSLCVITLALGWVGMSTLVLTFTEAASLTTILFEDLSAFGTVGLSRGLTPYLSVPGKIVIIITMLVGRVGPLALALSVAGQRAAEQYEYPEESVVVG